MIFYAYMVTEVSESALKMFSKYSKWRYQDVKSYAMAFNGKGWLDYTYDYGEGYVYWIRPEYFFPAALKILSEDRKYYESLQRSIPKRSKEARYLWTVAEEMYKCGLAGDDPSKRRPVPYIKGDSPDIDWSSYLFYVNDDGMMDEYVMQMKDYEFEEFFERRLNKYLLDDEASGESFWSRMENILKSYSSIYNFNPDYFLNLLYAGRYLSTGTLLPLPQKVSTGFPYIAVQAIQELYSSNFEKSVSLFADAVRLSNKTSKVKGVFENPLLSFYLVIAYVKSGTDQSNLKLSQLCNKKQLRMIPKFESVLFLANYLNRPFNSKVVEYDLQWMMGDHKLPLTRVLGAISSAHFNFPIPKDIIPNHAILRHEMSPFLQLADDEKERLEKAFGGHPLLPTIKIKEEWEALLDDLGRILNSGESTNNQDGGANERIGYFMSPDGSSLEVRIQSRLKSGQWGAGKRASMNDFMSGSLSAMDDIDKSVAKVAERSGWSSFNISSRSSLPHLVGSDRVYFGSYAPYELLKVVEEKPYLTIEKKKQGLAVSSNFTRNDFINHKKVAFHLDKKHLTVQVISLSDIQSKILNTLYSLPELPFSAEARLMDLLNSVSNHIEIHSNLIEGGSSLEKVVGDPTVHIQISPKNDFYIVRICTIPLPSGRLSFYPGEGDRTIYDEAEGKRYQVSRQISKERSFLSSLEDYLMDTSDLDEITESFSASAELVLHLVQWVQEQKNGFVVEWPSDKKIRISPVSSSSISIHRNSGENWFEAEGMITYGSGDGISLEKLLALVQSGNVIGNFIRLDDENYLSMTEMLKKQIKRLESISQMDRSGVRFSIFNVGYLADLLHNRQLDVASDGALEQLEMKIKEAATMDIPVPEGLNATLRDYQLEGFRWISRLDHWGAGACLADDMGLGKTLQAIAFILRKASVGASLVLAPASVVMNWKKEFARFAPSIRSYVLNEESDRQSIIDSASASDVVICSYGLLAHNDGLLNSRDWNVVCLDEAHTIKNRMTRTSASAMQLKASSRVILTGTPVQNYLGELWNLLQFLNPGLLGSFDSFSRRFISSDDKESLKRLVQPFILRRTKAEVLDELPEKTDIVRSVALSDQEMFVYENMRSRVEEHLKTETKVSVNVLSEITRLRQASCSIELVKNGWQGGSSKITELLLLLDEIISGGNSVLIFSQFTSFLDLVNAALDKAGYEYFYLNGSTPISQRSKMVASFQKGEKRIFVISLKAGGLGLNLTGANYVIHLDPWWNPAIEQQATDRAYRIGQKNSVTVYHLVSGHTIEEKILRLHDSKRQLAESVLEGTSAASTLSVDDLRELCSGI